MMDSRLCKKLLRMPCYLRAGQTCVDFRQGRSYSLIIQCSTFDARATLADLSKRGLTMKRMTVDTKCPRSVEGSADKKSYKMLLLAVVCVLALMISPAAMYGQAAGSFSGNVLDKSGSVVPGADVTVVSQATGLT